MGDSYTFTNINSNHEMLFCFEAYNYTITTTSNDGGTISPPGPIEAKHGTNQKFVIEPYHGQNVKDVKIDGLSVGAINEYVFENIDSDHNIETIFAPNTYTITTSVTGGVGKIIPPGPVTANHGSSLTFNFEPAEGFFVKDVVVDGLRQIPLPDNYSFTNIASDHAISVTYILSPHTIKATADFGGKISPSGIILVENGSSEEFAIKPEPGYHILDVTSDGDSVYDKLLFAEEEAKYTFYNVQTDHEINASFGYIIMATSELHGDISPNGPGRFAPGEKPKFTIAPDSGYYIKDIIIDGISFLNCLQYTEDEISYTFTALTSDHTIHAVFGETANASTSPSIAYPKRNILLQNYPNPFNPETWIPFYLCDSGSVSIRIYNINGQLIKVLELFWYYCHRHDNGSRMRKYNIILDTFNEKKSV